MVLFGRTSEKMAKRYAHLAPERLADYSDHIADRLGTKMTHDDTETKTG